MLSEWGNNNYLKKILQELEDLNKSYTFVLPNISHEIDRIRQSVSSRTMLSSYSELLENLSKSRLSTQSELLENLSTESRLFRYKGILNNQDNRSNLLPRHNIIGENLYLDLEKQISIWKKIVDSSLDIYRPSLRLNELAVASKVWDKNITKLTSQIQEINLFSKNPNLVQSLLAPSRVYTEFVDKTYQLLKKTKNDKVSWALETSLHLAEVQWVSTTNTLTNFVTVTEDDECVSNDKDLLLPIIQQNELIEIVESCEEQNEESIILLSPAAQASEQVRRIWQLIVQCNEIVQTKGQKEMFKSTTKLLEACTNLPWIIPQDKDSFAKFIDYLYFTFYEGTGKDNLRFLTKYDGVLETTDCNFIWCIKHLRNKWLRHDPDHGKEKDIQKSWQDLQEKFLWLGLDHMPIREQDFRLLHRSLLKEAESFMQLIVEKLIS
ncbi:hypothetical protein ACQFX9_05710 [Aliinostoc sp. HNIBRCY26]|uniref:hypothetical protein n=1 Tax=Aliinostoc sp. HNIBRCY26 TaxID=3418997 RepID=UPI003D0035B7